MIIKRFLTIFLFCSLLFGIPMGLLFGLALLILPGTTLTAIIATGLISGLLSGLAFGVLFSSTILGIDYFMGQEIRQKYPGSTMDVTQTEVIIIQNDLSSTYQKVQQSLRSLNYEITSESSETSLIKAKSGPSLRSWGESINIQLSKEDESNTQITITSKPSLRTTLIDYGKNLANVKQIADSLRN